jgi:hypothetical protein
LLIFLTFKNNSLKVNKDKDFIGVRIELERKLVVFSSWIIILFEGHVPIYPGGQAITGGKQGHCGFP